MMINKRLWVSDIILLYELLGNRMELEIEHLLMNKPDNLHRILRRVEE